MTDYKLQLKDLTVPFPCTQDWNKMTGNEQARHCSQCKQNVYNLSEMTERQAQKLLDDTQGKVCVRFYQRPDGTILTRDCARIRRSITRKKQNFAAAAATLIALVNALSASAKPANSTSDANTTGDTKKATSNSSSTTTNTTNTSNTAGTSNSAGSSDTTSATSTTSTTGDDGTKRHRPLMGKIAPRPILVPTGEPKLNPNSMIMGAPPVQQSTKPAQK